MIFLSIAAIGFLSIISCTKENFDLPAPTPLYDFPDNKLWAHQVNTVEDANAKLKEFDGIEIDVYFFEGDNEFHTGHDVASELTLDQLFNGIPRCSKYYYWIDFKNLSDENAFVAVKRMKEMISKYHLEKRVIVENSTAYLLNYFEEDSIFTSYWVPSVSDVTFSFFAENALQKKVAENLEKYRFDAISADYSMYPFLNKYFPAWNIHLWTNGLDENSDKKTVKQLSHQSNIKVILVDFDENILTSSQLQH